MDDYESDAFVQQAAAQEQKHDADLSYAERRRRQLAKSHDKGRVVSRKTREEEARQEGLERNLFDKAKEEGGTNKAYQMMLKMGYRHGAKPESRQSSEESSTPPPARSGLGSRPGLGSGLGASTSAQSSSIKPDIRAGSGSPLPPPAATSSSAARPSARDRSEPIKINIMQGRSGLGRPGANAEGERHAKRRRVDLDTSQYVSQTRDTFEERRLHGRVRAVAKVGAELDARKGIEGNKLWSIIAASDEDDGDAAVSRQESLRRNMTQREGDDLSGTVVELDEEPVATAEDDEWSSLPPSDQLKAMLEYLRDKHVYCFYCGQFQDSGELATICPGLYEDDHD